MHIITSDRQAVLKLLRNTIHQLGKDHPKSKDAGFAALELSCEDQWPETRDRVIDELKHGYDRAINSELNSGSELYSIDESVPQPWYVPRDRTLAIFQAAMDEYLTGTQEKKQLRKKKEKSAFHASVHPRVATYKEFLAKKRIPMLDQEPIRDLFLEQFDELDPRWIEVVWEKAKLLLIGKHPFIKHSSETDFRFVLKERARIVIVGDWGGGNAAAQAVAKQIQSLVPPPDHLIHLGDVYYAGTLREVQDRFLNFWPAPTEPGQSFALNSNHEMYSGGYGYFDVTLQHFKQPASYFSIANKFWRFIGLDTGYVDHDLNREQVNWLEAQINTLGPKNVLLTHHQIFSAFEDTNCESLLSRVAPFIFQKKIYGWVWGHEHLCVAYKENMGIKARCVGNGCIPYNPPTISPRLPIEWVNTRPQPDDNIYRGIHTFALLDISGQTIKISYVDQDGKVGFEEEWS